VSSSTNDDGISALQWADDNRTVYFLGEQRRQVRQVYKIDVVTLKLEKITDAPTNVLSFSVSRNGRHIAYVSERPVTGMWERDMNRKGLIITSQYLFNILQNRSASPHFGDEPQLFVLSNGKLVRLKTVGKIGTWGGTPRLSPDGHFLLIDTQAADIPPEWKQYSDPMVHAIASEKLTAGQYAFLETLELIDTNTGNGRVLLNSPLADIIGGRQSECLWAPDGHSVAVSGIYLPLTGTVGDERTLRESRSFAIEIQLPAATIQKIANGDLKLLSWHDGGATLAFELLQPEHPDKGHRIIEFRRSKNAWVQETIPRSDSPRPTITLDEGLNTAPTIIAVDPQTGQKKLLLDLNPQFRQLEFAKEEIIQWSLKDGTEVIGGLYYPHNYVAGKRYPVVIQTHGFSQNRFWIDGPWTTAFAAQPLAAKGIMVLQADESYTNINTPDEVDREVSRIEGAIDFLEQRQLIDPTRIGIIGFSRTCLFVKYLLTHSKYHFAAASITDGFDAGYLQYLMYANSDSYDAHAIETTNGGQPFGPGLSEWIKRSPSFNIERVHTPLRIVGVHAINALSEWEWFALLSRMNRPVDMVVLKDGSHILQKPWDRMVSQQGNVDWFAFWLLGDEDSNKDKTDEYARWRDLRSKALQTATDPRVN